MMEQKIKQDGIPIGENIRRIRKQKGLKQIETVRELQLLGIDMTGESFVKVYVYYGEPTPYSRYSAYLCESAKGN